MSLDLEKTRSEQQQQQQTSVIVVGAPASGSGKTTVTCGLIAAYAARGLSVKCCKTGPDFLDGMQHRATLQAGRRMTKKRDDAAKSGLTSDDNEDDDTSSTAKTTRSKRRQLASRTANLDGWMQGGSPDAVRATFLRHLYDDDDEADDNNTGNGQSPTPPTCASSRA